VRPPPGADDGVNLVDDDGPRRPQHLTAALGGEQQIERFGRRHQDMWRRSQHRRPLGRGRVAGPHSSRDARNLQTRGFRQMPQRAPRFSEVLMDIRAQCLERRYVDDAYGIRQRRLRALADEVVNRRQKSRERLA
jgi:hypothetical protein